MDKMLCIYIGFIIFFGLLITGHYVSTVLFTTGIVGVILLSGGNMQTAIGLLVTEPYRQAVSYTMSTVPMYVIMAEFIMESGIVRDCYAIVFKVSKGKKGVLGALTEVLGGFLGAVSGSAMATSASLGKISVPELRSRGYSSALAGCVAATAGSLSAVIPPSMTLIIYGQLAEVSVGKLFVATLVPGILVMLVFIILIFIILATKKEKLRAAEDADEFAGEKEEIELKLSRVLMVLFVGVALIGVIFIGIYTGKFSPTEAGAVGAFMGFLVAVMTKTLSVKMLKKAMLNTVKTTGMVIFVITSASFFSRFVTLSLFPRVIMNSLGSLMDHPNLILFMIMIVYTIVFMLLDGSSGITMTLPILLPIVKAIGVDLIWFGIFLCLLSTMGGLTPPVGLCVFSAAGSSKIPMAKIFPLALLFALVAIVAVGGLMIAFPGLATYLPGLM